MTISTADGLMFGFLCRHMIIKFRKARLLSLGIESFSSLEVHSRNFLPVATSYNIAPNEKISHEGFGFASAFEFSNSGATYPPSPVSYTHLTLPTKA